MDDEVPSSNGAGNKTTGASSVAAAEGVIAGSSGIPIQGSLFKYLFHEDPRDQTFDYRCAVVTDGLRNVVDWVAIGESLERHVGGIVRTRGKLIKYGIDRLDVDHYTCEDSAMSIEFLGNTVRVDVAMGGFAHTNHSFHDPASGGDLLENSTARLRAAYSLIPVVDFHHAAFDALASSDGAHPICAPYVMYEGMEIGTVATVDLLDPLR